MNDTATGVGAPGIHFEKNQNHWLAELPEWIYDFFDSRRDQRGHHVYAAYLDEDRQNVPCIWLWEALVRESRLPIELKGLLFVLRSRLPNIIIGKKQLALDASIGDTNLKAAVGSLELLGWLDVWRQKDPNNPRRNLPNEYSLTFPATNVLAIGAGVGDLRAFHRDLEAIR